MQFYQKQFESGKGFLLTPTGISQLSELIARRIDLSMAFAIYQSEEMDDDSPIVGHAGEFDGELLAPIASYPSEESYSGDANGRKVYMLDADKHSPKIIQVPTGIPLVGMRDSYRYRLALQKFYTAQSVESILDGLRNDGWKDYLYTKANVGPMDFTPTSNLQRNLIEL